MIKPVEFSPLKHTKEYLLTNLCELDYLCIHSEAFSKNMICQDLKFLTTVINQNGDTVAHVLASNQPEWLSTPAASNLDIMSIKNKFGVAVIRNVIEHQHCLSLDYLFNKDILSIRRLEYLEETNDLIISESIAEAVASKYGRSHGVDLPFVIVKLITQGAAYFQFGFLSPEVGESVLLRVNEQIFREHNQKRKMAMAIAMHSTCCHALNKYSQVSSINQEMSQLHRERWSEILREAEHLVSYACSLDTKILENDLIIDFNCEPSESIWRKMQAEYNFSIDALNSVKVVESVGDETLLIF